MEILIVRCIKYDPPSEEELSAIKIKEEELEMKQEEQFVVRGTSDQSKIELRHQLADKIMAASTKTLKQPSFVFRPPPLTGQLEDLYQRLKKHSSNVELCQEIEVMLPVFQFLTTPQLAVAAR